MINFKKDEAVETEVEEAYDYMNEEPLAEDDTRDDEYEDVIECD